MLSCVINNLLSNAIKFTPNGEKINISGEIKDTKYFQVCIADTGIGISHEDISKLFRIDQDYSTHSTNDEKGTGLGLILCKDFVTRMKGEIWVESEVNKGSRFCFTVPVQTEVNIS